MKNAFDVLIGRRDTAEKRISELQDSSIETSKTEKQTNKQKRQNKQTNPPQNRISKNYGTTIKGVCHIHIKRIPEGKERKMKGDITTDPTDI